LGTHALLKTRSKYLSHVSGILVLAGITAGYEGWLVYHADGSFAAPGGRIWMVLCFTFLSLACMVFTTSIAVRGEFVTDLDHIPRKNKPYLWLVLVGGYIAFLACFVCMVLFVLSLIPVLFQ
jgi:hypothetical protein